MVGLEFHICPKCDAHFVGYRNQCGICFCCLAIYWLITNNEIINALQPKRRNNENINDTLVYISDARIQLFGGIKVQPEMLLFEMDINPRLKIGGYPHMAFENFYEKLVSFGVLQKSRAAVNLCTVCKKIIDRDENICFLSLDNDTDLSTCLTKKFLYEPVINIWCSKCLEDTECSNRLSILKLGEYLAFHVTHSRTFSFPMLLKLKSDYFHNSAKQKYCKTYLKYIGHSITEGEGEEEHSIAIVPYDNMLHKIDNEFHTVCKMPEENSTITDLKVDLIIYKVLNQVNGKPNLGTIKTY